MPTVTQNLKALEAIDLVTREGHFDSTGGRKAQIYHFNVRTRIAIGVLLLKEGYHIVATDLYGQKIDAVSYLVPISAEPAYLQTLGSRLEAFVSSVAKTPKQILGVKIAVQGLVSQQGDTIFYGKITNYTGLTLHAVQPYIPYPCSFVHDTEASAIAELWAQKELKNAALLSLSHNFSGLLVLDGSIRRGNTLNGTIEHMCLHPGGAPCYCGQRGCVEAYCSADALLQEAGEPLPAFFKTLRAGDAAREKIWTRYLHNLALCINNIRMVLDLDYVLCGYLLQFLTDEDLERLSQYAAETCAFDLPRIRIWRSAFSTDVAAYGAAISLVSDFLHRDEIV